MAKGTPSFAIIQWLNGAIHDGRLGIFMGTSTPAVTGYTNSCGRLTALSMRVRRSMATARLHSTN